jgi:hypothetical protein
MLAACSRTMATERMLFRGRPRTPSNKSSLFIARLKVQPRPEQTRRMHLYLVLWMSIAGEPCGPSM